MFNKPPSIYWSDKTKMEWLQRRIIVASIQYYEMNCNCITDNEYDKMSQKLVELIKQSTKEFKKTRYYYCFKEFDGSTGFDIPRKLNRSDKEYLTCIARQVYEAYNKRRN